MPDSSMVAARAAQTMLLCAQQTTRTGELQPPANRCEEGIFSLVHLA